MPGQSSNVCIVISALTQHLSTKLATLVICAGLAFAVTVSLPQAHPVATQALQEMAERCLRI